MLALPNAYPSGQVRFQPLLGQSRVMRAVLERIEKLATSNVRVLIHGETGTGKELCAQAIHKASKREAKPFVAMNCGALPETLADNELFGHERGAFTGAEGSLPGRIGEAKGGTLLLDEIDALPLAVQVKVLRFLQDGKYHPLGGAHPRQADVRVLAATNSDLNRALKESRFRLDLYHRINGATILMPPLRDRPEDIPFLAMHFLRRFASLY